MLTMLLSARAVYVVAEPVDLCKSIDGLALAVESGLGASPLSGSVYVFFNRSGNKLKLLWRDRHGFWLVYKRLEQGRFRRPLTSAITRSELLEGVDLSVRRFREVRAGRVS